MDQVDLEDLEDLEDPEDQVDLEVQEDQVDLTAHGDFGETDQDPVDQTDHMDPMTRQPAARQISDTPTVQLTKATWTWTTTGRPS